MMSRVKDFFIIIKDISRIAEDIFKYQVDYITESQKQVLRRLLTWLLLVMTSIVISLVGLLFILWGTHILLSFEIGQVAASFVIGFLLVAVGMIIYLLTASYLKDY